MFQKIPRKGRSILNKIGAISILQSAHKQGNPSFHFHAPGSKRRYPCTQAASAVPKYFPVRSSFVLVIASDMHLEPENEKRSFSHNYKYPGTIHAFSLFLDEFLSNDPRPIYSSLTCSHTSTFFLGNNTPFSET